MITLWKCRRLSTAQRIANLAKPPCVPYTLQLIIVTALCSGCICIIHLGNNVAEGLPLDVPSDPASTPAQEYEIGP